jgi:hypothetical protein
VHRVRNGLPREEKGGTSIDRPDGSTFGKHFFDELKTQLGRAERLEQNSTSVRKEPNISEARRPKPRISEEETAKNEGSDAAWQDYQRRAAEPPKQHFMAEYMDALRAQMRNDKASK